MVPVVWDGAGKTWLVLKWALKYIKAGKVVQRATNNQQHNGAPQRSRAKKKVGGRDRTSSGFLFKQTTVYI